MTSPPLPEYRFFPHSLTIQHWFLLLASNASAFIFFFLTVSLKWRLHFEFVTSREPGLVLLPPLEQPEPVTWTGPEQVPVDTFSWDLPIKVLPTSPTLASYAAPGPSTSTITI